MSCITNINRFIIPNDVISSLTKIYKFIGKNEYYKKSLSNDYNRVIEQTVERDSYFLAKLLELDISDSRMRLIITKDSNPRSVDETTLYNIKETLMMFQKKYQSLTIKSEDLINMINYIYSSKTIKYGYEHQEKKDIIQNQQLKSKRITIDEINEIVIKSVENDEFEEIVLYLHYYLDFYNLQPFDSKNDCAAFLVLYLLILKSNVDSFKYISFFEMIYNNYNEFIDEVKKASLNWEEGYSQTIRFIRFMIKLFLESYIKTDNIIIDYANDQNINKSDNIENTISKLPKIFTKDEIRLIHPYVSESTINRTLSKMRNENTIKPLGKGRSAKWIKL